MNLGKCPLRIVCSPLFYTVTKVDGLRVVRLKLPYRWGLEAHASRDHTLVRPLREGYHESRRCSRDTRPESHIIKYTILRSRHRIHPCCETSHSRLLSGWAPRLCMFNKGPERQSTSTRNCLKQSALGKAFLPGKCSTKMLYYHKYDQIVL